MAPLPTLAICTLSILLLSACGDDESRAHQPVSGSSVAQVAVEPLPAMAREREVALERQIAQLSEIQSYRDGYDDGWFGTPGDLPWERRGGPDSRLAGAHMRLVEAGAEVIPLLLAHLEDPTPTKLVYKAAPSAGAMWVSAEVPYNANDPVERRAVEDVIPEEDRTAAARWGQSTEPDRRKYVNEHRLRIGDVCFAILGDITNRDYAAVRGAPTMNLVVNSPVLDPRLAVAVRAMWQGRDPRQSLAARLVRDAELRPSEESGTRLVVGAAARLAYYFRREAATYLAARLDGLRFGVPVDLRFGLPSDAEYDPGNWGAGEMVEVLAPVGSSVVRDAVVRALRRESEAGHVLSASLQLEGRPEQAVAIRWQRILDTAKPKTQPADLPSIADLRAADTAFPAAAPDMLIKSISDGSPTAWNEMLHLVDQLDPMRRPPYLRRLLEVSVFWSDDPSVPGGPAPKPLRVSDRAAIRIAALRPDLPFDPLALHRDRDARIREIAGVLYREER